MLSALRRLDPRRHPGSRWFFVAVAVGFVLRLAWAIWATKTPQEPFSDNARYLAMAVRFSGLGTETINGHTTAFTPPGYSALLSPLAYAARHTGWFGLPIAASMLNVVAGTFTVAATGLLAGRWFGTASRAVAAWLMALAPAHIYFTSTALTETVFAALVVGVLLAVTILVQGPWRSRSTWVWLVLGAVIGYTALVRFPGALLIAVPALTIRACTGSWRDSLRVTGWVALAAVLTLVPWTIRNGVQVGVWTPTSTNAAAFFCSGHHPGSTGEIPYDGPPECFRGSPFDPDSVDEPRWYRDTSRDAVKWSASHPFETVRNAAWVSYEMMRDDRDALQSAQDFRGALVGERVAGVLDSLATLWHLGVLVLAIAGLVLLAACRRAIPVWATTAALFALSWGGVGLTRFHTPFQPLLACFAAAALAAMSRGAASPPTPATSAQGAASFDSPSPPRPRSVD